LSFFILLRRVERLAMSHRPLASAGGTGRSCHGWGSSEGATALATSNGPALPAYGVQARAGLTRLVAASQEVIRRCPRMDNPYLSM